MLGRSLWLLICLSPYTVCVDNLRDVDKHFNRQPPGPNASATHQSHSEYRFVDQSVQ